MVIKHMYMSFSWEQVLSQMHHFEIKRQELLKELIHTERTHLKKLLIMKHVRPGVRSSLHDV